jgi:DNA-binding MarR family transcriptional regulator
MATPYFGVPADGDCWRGVGGTTTGAELTVDVELTDVHERVLRAIEAGSGHKLRIGLIAEAAGVSRHARDQALSALVRARLVLRTWSEADGRQRIYSLTEAGRGQLGKRQASSCG